MKLYDVAKSMSRVPSFEGAKLVVVALLTVVALAAPTGAVATTVSAKSAAKRISITSSTKRALASTSCTGGTLLYGYGWLDGKGVDVESNAPHEGSGTSCGGTSYVNGVLAGSQWQCVELVNRLYLTRGWIRATWYGNGNTLYGQNATNVGLTNQELQGHISHIAPGDVLSLNVPNGHGGFTPAGHTEVISTVTTTSGGGYSAKTVSQNYGPVYDGVTLSNGTATMASKMSVVGVIHAPTAIHASVALIPNQPVASGYRLDGFGHLYPFGDAPPVTSSPRWSWDIARGVAIFPDSTAFAVRGYVLDGWGGIHPFAAGNADPPPRPIQYAYWQGFDIARGIVLRGNTSTGYVLDGYGGVHPFAPSGVALPPTPAITGYWQGWDIARAIVLASAISGYVLDGWGGIHPFGGAPRVSASAYWQGWDIARGIVLASTGGYVLDGWGGIHPFGGAPGVSRTWPWTSNNDIYRGIAFDPSTSRGAVVTESIPGKAYQW
jgi:hypothetical protein